MTKKRKCFELLRKLTLGISKHYFKAEVRGLDNIPEGSCLLVGNHNGIGVVNPEIWIFGSHYFTYLSRQSPLKALGHDLVLKVPFISSLSKQYLGYIPNNFESAKKALMEGCQLLVYPGGGWESARPSADRDLIDFKQRCGFVKLARESGVPIVPIVATGAHDGLYVWRRGARIAKLIGLHRVFRIDVFPLGLSFPFGIHVGPLFPFIPLPRKVIIEVLPPIQIDEQAGLNDSHIACNIIEAMQAAMDRNVSELPRSKC